MNYVINFYDVRPINNQESLDVENQSKEKESDFAGRINKEEKKMGLVREENIIKYLAYKTQVKEVDFLVFILN